jgi:hypothetical protein
MVASPTKDGQLQRGEQAPFAAYLSPKISRKPGTRDGKAALENKGVMVTDFFGFRVFRQSQRRHTGDGVQRPLRSGFQARLMPGVDMTSNVKSWRKNSRLFVTFGEYQMMAQLVTRRWLVSPLIHKDFRAYHPPLGHGNCASVTLHHQK